MSFLSYIKRLAGRQPGRGPTRGGRRPRRAALALESLEDRCVPAVLTVTSLADSFDPGTLRAAVVQANSDGAGGVADAIQFAPDLSGTLTLVAPLELTPGAGVTINGSPAVTLSGGGASQVFYVDAGASVALNGLTIIYGAGYDGGAIINAGSLTLNGDTLSGNAASDAGGAIYNAGSLTLNGDTLSGNSAYVGGGGICNQGALTLYACTLSGNSAYTLGVPTFGGGIYNSGTLTLDASTLSGNSAKLGGGLFNDATGYAFVQDNCNLSGNAAGAGGAIENLGQLSVSGGTLWANRADLEGGAIANNSYMAVEGANLSYNVAQSGGAVYNGYHGWGLIDGSVLSSNSVALSGGAVTNNGQLTLSSDWLTYNTAELGGAVFNNYGGLTMSDDTVAGNTAVQGGGIWNAYTQGALAMIRDNVSSNALRLPTASDPDPNLQPLGSGLYTPYGSLSLDGSTYIGGNFKADGSLGGDTYYGV
jgi:hypothetical protein